MRYCIPLLICVSLVALLSCASSPPTYTADMTPEDYLQMAQERADRGEYQIAIDVYYKMKETFPNNLEKNIWASYEIAFLYHKMGNDAKSLELLDELLTLYSQDQRNVLPKAPKILAEQVKSNIENKGQYDNKLAPTPSPIR